LSATKPIGQEPGDRYDVAAVGVRGFPDRYMLIGFRGAGSYRCRVLEQAWGSGGLPGKAPNGYPAPVKSESIGKFLSFRRELQQEWPSGPRGATPRFAARPPTDPDELRQYGRDKLTLRSRYPFGTRVDRAAFGRGQKNTLVGRHLRRQAGGPQNSCARHGSLQRGGAAIRVSGGVKGKIYPRNWPRHSRSITGLRRG